MDRVFVVTCSFSAVHQLSAAVDRLSAKTDHLSETVRSLSAALRSLSATVSHDLAAANKSSTDDALFHATVWLAVVTFGVALVPLILDRLAVTRERSAVRRQMQAIVEIVEARVKHLSENPAYPSAVLKEGLDGFLSRSLQTEVGRAFKTDELNTVYNALTTASATMTEAAHQQHYLAEKVSALNAAALQALQQTVYETIRGTAGDAVKAMQLASQLFTAASKAT